MSLLDRLERKFRKFAIKGLMLHIVALNMAVFLLHLVKPEVIDLLYLNPFLISKGEVWRLITYIFIPPVLGFSSIIWILFVLSLYYTIGTALEQEWGSFKFNLFYLTGMIGTTVATYIMNMYTGGSMGTATFLNMSLFLAFARIYPNYEIMLFFFIPVKVKYMAWLNWFGISFVILMPLIPLSFKVAAIMSIINYFLFFGKDILFRSRTRGGSIVRKTKFNLSKPHKAFMHKCTVCGITEKDNPQAEFRYCSSCEGDYEYCMDHLKNHEHIKNETDS
jgi:membrane associated rhomboid family serine protease